MTMNESMKAFEPIPEQQKALDLFLGERSLRIDAYAGAGKTTTLRFLASNTPRRGVYIAFNRSIASEARQKFPPQITCTTSHSIAFRNVRRAFRFSDMKLTGSLTIHVLTETFRLPEDVTFRSGLTLSGRSYAAVLIEGVRAFVRSNDPIPSRLHIPRFGLLEFTPDAQFEAFCEQAAEHLQVIWSNMCARESPLPLGHDGYLKLWALSNPVPRMDYIMIDEAQDLNPVLLGVLCRVHCQIVYVGDPYQQIYDWRGAINAMDQVDVDDRVLLSQSFRYGPAIANAATQVIRILGATEFVRGLAEIPSHIARVRPNVVLSRSNAGVIGNVLHSLSRNQPCHVLGGTSALQSLLEDVKRIKAGVVAVGQELLGFSSWKDVLAHSVRPEGSQLRTLVNLVAEYGEATMLAGLRRCEPEEGTAHIVCSTAHRAKGREWEYVRVDDDFEGAIARARKSQGTTNAGSEYEAEMRLLYVALTRARLAVELPSALMQQLGLHYTSREILGANPAATFTLPPNSPHPETEAASPSVSPYHSPQNGESAQMAAVRRFFR